MKNFYLLIVFWLLFIVSGKASPADSVSTIYKDGVFVTYCNLNVNANDSISNVVINKFVQQMCYDIDGLFKWGLKGMSVENEKNDLLTFDFRETKYDKKTCVLRGIGDVIVPGITTFPNLFIDSKLEQRKFTSGKRNISLELAKPNSFIKSMTGVFTFIPKNKNKSGNYQLETHIKFGWFFNIFITQNRYKKIMEWRLRKLVLNIKEESEKREKTLTMNNKN